MRLLLITAVVNFSLGAVHAADPAPKHFHVVAHRGAHRQAPENSLAAIRKAIEIGCDYVEVDVRTTLDGRLVLMHDPTVDRTTDGSGPVGQMPFAAIRRLQFGPEWPRERVPTFEEAITVCKGRIKLYIDHKEASPNRVLEFVRLHRVLSDVIVYGDVETLREYKRLCPAVWIMPPHPKSSAAIRKLADDLHPETLDGNITEWTAEPVKVAHDVGVQVWVDNPPMLDNEAGIRAAVELGVDAIQTDHPAKVIRIVESLGARRK